MALLAFAVAGCSSDAPDTTTPLENEAFIGLDDQVPLTLGVNSASVSENASRGFRQITNDNLTEEYCQIGMFACNTRHDKFDTENSKVGNYIRNLHYVPSNKVDASKYWYGEPRAWWPLDADDNLTFFCYAPYDVHQTYISDNRYYDEMSGKFVLEYHVDSLPHQQVDFCVAEPITNLSLRKLVTEKAIDKEEGDPYYNCHLPFNFHHALTWVTFYGRYIGQLPDPIARCIIYQIKLENVISRKLLTFNMNGTTKMNGSPDDFATWTDDDNAEITDADFSSFTITKNESSHLHTYTTLNSADDASAPEYEYDSDGTTILKDQSHLELLNNGGWLFMIPQTLTRKKVKLTITFELRTAIDNSVNSDLVMGYVTRETYLPDDPEDPNYRMWLPGKQVIYYLDVDLTPMSQLIITPMLVDWEDGNSHGDAEDPEILTPAGDSSMHIE